MKKFFLLSLCLAGTLFLGCDNDDDNPTPEEIFVAVIDGNAFEASNVIATETSLGGETLVFIRGTETSSGDAIGLNIPLSATTGTTFQVDATDLGITFTDADENAFFTVGELTLNENDKDNNVLAGTFSFTATDDSNPTNVREITDGEFRVIY